ncbi:MAG: 4a-hydroxytetrahydrobiopterin dehydratase [Gammaproteobacteria bacterium]|nr:4a-hydroxytetrahydrobiopterin dehydratase [Gammaproteobacteria bacterium]MDH4315631.1 4a-hydroxytetrahydrobiopterin dehydratase [Gammaproteobacteria bacterium]MDH5215502.1 4a-hydroxytetrahydrobiopterin dehydratase [Gammaproteobacteria bacterium]
MSKLAEKKCKPCEGGVEPLSPEQADLQLADLDPGWKRVADGQTIEREFEFPSFSRTIAFVNAVAWIATVEGHHPEMLVRYRSCRVSYRTTAIDGLSENDFICAAKIDQLVEGT